jgi:hypothetical protein
MIMPKTNDASGATYYGHEGIVEHAGGAGSTRPGGLSEVDHARNLDGSVIDGYESEEREVEDVEGGRPAEPILLERPETEEKPLGDREDHSDEGVSSTETEQRTETEKEVPSSRGSSSEASLSSNAKTSRGRTSEK